MARIAIGLKGYPRLSESFIAQELLGLERAGLRLDLVALRQPTDRYTHPIHAEIAAPVHYLPEYLHEAPARVVAAWRHCRRLPHYPRMRALFLRDLGRDRSRNRLRRWGQAMVMAYEMAADTTMVYAHFLHTPASVARYAAGLRGLDWAVSAHAKDVWTTPPWDLRQKLADCAWATTCTAVGQRYLTSLSPAGKPVRLGYHGLDFARFGTPPVAVEVARDGRTAALAVRLLSIGRAVEKKGYSDLLAALAVLPPTCHWRLVHIGAGPQARALAREAEARGLADRIEWRGAAAQSDVLAAYRSADLFVLASRIAADGDRDGLPNVLVEAQSQRLACLSTRVSAIPELIEDGRTGLLVEPQDPAALAAALERLIGRPDLRARLGEAGYQRVRAQFGRERTIDRLASLLGGTPDAESICLSASTRR